MSARCYCGASRLTFSSAPRTVAYCHCRDCRRWTGGPVAAFAAFDRADLTAEPALAPPLVHVEGVERWMCPTCGSPLAAQFSYLPGQVYVPVGIMDQAVDMVPQVHCHADSALPWLHIVDDAPREGGTARTTLNLSST